MITHICRVVNICEIVLKYIKSNFVNQTKLALEIGTSKSNLSNRLRGNTMDTLMLFNLSVALKHDFFQYLSKELAENNKIQIIESKKYNQPIPQTEEYIKLLEENLELHRSLRKEKEEADGLKRGSKHIPTKQS